MKNDSRPLCRFSPGDRVRVEDLEGCRQARAKLYAMGLTPGTELEVVSAGHGPCRLKVRGTDVVLGHGLSQKIFACPLEECIKDKRCRGDDF